MHIVEENAEGFLRAFHGGQNEMIVALLILTVRRIDLALFKSLLEGVTEIDQALGDEIGLFLFYPGQKAGLTGGYSNSRVLAGERLDGPSKIGTNTRASNFFKPLTGWAESARYDRQTAVLVAQSSAKIVPEFCEALSIDPGELPCICTLIKGIPGAIVSRAGDRLSYDSVVCAAHAMRPQIQRIQLEFNQVLASIPTLRSGIALLERSDAQKQRLCEQILNLADGLERRHALILRPQLSAMLNAGTLTADSLESLVREVAKERSDMVLTNSRTGGIRTRLSKLMMLDADVTHFRSVYDIAKLNQYRAIVENAEPELRRAAESAFAEAGITIWRYHDQFAQLSKAGPILGVITKAMTVLRRTILPI